MIPQQLLILHHLPLKLLQRWTNPRRAVLENSGKTKIPCIHKQRVRKDQRYLHSLPLSVSTAASASSKDIILATVASAEKNTNSAVADAAAENDVLGTTFAASSMKRSFEKLSKIDLSDNRANNQAPDYLFGFGGSHGGGLWGPKESTQEEIDGLISFANKYIIRGRGERGSVGGNVQEDGASKGSTL
jgi:hypothetical protein